MDKRNWVLNPYYKIKKAKTLYVHDANKVYDKKNLMQVFRYYE